MREVKSNFPKIFPGVLYKGVEGGWRRVQGGKNTSLREGEYKKKS
jgi:hypothetical protein